MIKGVRATTVQEDLDIVVREVKNCPTDYDKTERVLLIDADSIMYFATHFPEESLMEFPTEEEIDADLINAGKQTVTMATGASVFDSAESFAMIRGGHVDLTVLGAFEVDVNGNIASYMIPGKLIKGMGGAMDLVAGADNIIVTMTHASKHGVSKLLKSCSLPLTGRGCIKKILTDLAFIEIKDGKFHLLERAPGVSVEEIIKLTEGELVVSGDVPEMKF